jgi:glucose dehydrogenase
MTAPFVLLALSAAIGLALGTSFSWFAILVPSVAVAGLSAAVLQIAGFGVIPGIAIVVACLTVNQLAYVMRVTLANHSPERPDKESDARGSTNLKQRHGVFDSVPSDNGQSNVAHKDGRKQNAPT